MSDKELELFMAKQMKHMSKAFDMKKEWEANSEKYGNIPMEIQEKTPPQPSSLD